MSTAIKLIGVDFTSSPSRTKRITVAQGQLVVNADSRARAVTLGSKDGKPRKTSRVAYIGAQDSSLTDASSVYLLLERLDQFPTWEPFEQLLEAPGPWIGGFDFPFSLPRELVEHLNWPRDWASLVLHCNGLTRSQLRDTFKAFCDARPVGQKFAHRATDIPAGSSSSMKWVNPPVAYMFHEGAKRLLNAHCSLPGMFEGRPDAIALEAYPGLLARSITKASYKSDDKAKQTPERLAERISIVEALQTGQHRLKLKVQLTAHQRQALIDDPGADLLDAVLCLVQAAWASQADQTTFETETLGQSERIAPTTGLLATVASRHYGLKPGFDPLEGWIIGA
jgi:hypothetical protein